MNRQILQEAAEWFVEFSTDMPDIATRTQFDAWLRASPEHVRAFLELIPVWEDAAGLPLDKNPSAEQLIEWARAADNVVHMQPAAASRSTQPQLQPRDTVQRWLRPLLAASLVIALAGAALLWQYRAERYQSYATSVGEQRSLVLADSSTVELNTRSRIRVHYTAHERSIELLEGQALFKVAKNVERPFVVYSNGTQVLAVGTQFDVYKKNTGTVITVVEGRVAVYDKATMAGKAASDAAAANDAQRLPWVPQNAILLGAGEQLTVTTQGPQQIEHPSLAGVTAWTERQLVFDAAQLSDVVQEFNRYNVRRLTIDRGLLDDFRISGIFSSTDPSSLIRFLREQPGVRVVELQDEIQVSHE